MVATRNRKSGPSGTPTRRTRSTPMVSAPSDTGQPAATSQYSDTRMSADSNQASETDTSQHTETSQTVGSKPSDSSESEIVDIDASKKEDLEASETVGLDASEIVDLDGSETVDLETSEAGNDDLVDLDASEVIDICSTQGSLGLNSPRSRLDDLDDLEDDEEMLELNRSLDADCLLSLDHDESDIIRADVEANELVQLSSLTSDVIIPSIGTNTSIIDIVDYNAEIENEIELSSDEEEEQDVGEISLVCLKRPLPVETTVECLEILDSDEEFPVCLGPPAHVDTVNIEEKKGTIKEYIENEGLGIIHSEFGLVLFHLENVWVNGEKYSRTKTRKLLPLGTIISFYDRDYEGPEYRILTKEEVLLQAVVIWSGPRPKHLMKIVDNLDQTFWDTLEEYRKTFLLYLRGEVFLPVSFVRIKGTVKGYLNQEIGIIEIIDEERVKQNVVFHSDDVWIFRKTVRQYPARLIELLPVGLSVSVDTRRIHIPGVKNLVYQAVCVFAGTWPMFPHPTLLPGGPGSYAPTYEPPEEKSTYYYLELALESTLKRKVYMVKEFLSKHGGQLIYDWEGVSVVCDQADKDAWRETIQPGRRRNTKRTRPQHKNWDEKRPNTHAFKAPPIRRFKTKDEMDTGSEVANCGGSSAGSLSGVSSLFSRTHSRSSGYSDASGSAPKRSWFNPAHGGLRVKTEIKTEYNEYDENGGFMAKRMKFEI